MKISTSNNLIGSAIWSKWAQVNISKATKLHKWKIQVLIYTKLHEKSCCYLLILSCKTHHRWSRVTKFWQCTHAICTHVTTNFQLIRQAFFFMYIITNQIKTEQSKTNTSHLAAILWLIFSFPLFEPNIYQKSCILPVL